MINTWSLRNIRQLSIDQVYNVYSKYIKSNIKKRLHPDNISLVFNEINKIY